MEVFINIIKRELLLYARQRSEYFTNILFFFSIVSVFLFTLGFDAKLLATIFPTVIWSAALITVLLTQDNLLRYDYQLGIIEKFLVSQNNLYIIFLAKILSHWFITGIPIIILTPMLGLFFNINIDTMFVIVLSLVFGTGILSFFTAIGVSLTIILRKGGMLLAILILPLYIPVMILGVSAAMYQVDGISYYAQIALLAAILLSCITFVPFVVSSAIKIGLE